MQFLPLGFGKRFSICEVSGCKNSVLGNPVIFTLALLALLTYQLIAFLFNVKRKFFKTAFAGKYNIFYYIEQVMLNTSFIVKSHMHCNPYFWA